MNETEYIISRIKFLEKIIENPLVPQNVKLNQQNALKNYKSELRRLSQKSF